jgi:hypothetical protein
MKSRQLANVELLEILTKIVVQNPDLRFSQILSAYGFVRHNRPVSQTGADLANVHWKDEFYEEPEVILKRVKNMIGEK